MTTDTDEQMLSTIWKWQRLAVQSINQLPVDGSTNSTSS